MKVRFLNTKDNEDIHKGYTKKILDFVCFVKVLMLFYINYS
jgi:hypothetical protein